MAKATKMDKLMTPLTRLLRHVNKQSFGANAATPIAEAIDTPGYGGDFSTRKGYRTAPYLHEAFVHIDPAQDTPGATAGVVYRVQILDGDHAAAIIAGDMVDADEEDLLADYRRECAMVTSGGTQHLSPDPMVITSPFPFLVQKKFTIAHQAGNHAAWNSNDVFVTLLYQVMEVHHEIYTELLLDKQRQS